MSHDFRIKQLQSAKLSDAQLTRLAQLWRQLDVAENSYDGKHGLEMVPSTDEGCRAFIQKADRGITAAIDKDDKILGFATNMPAREYKNVNYISALTVDENSRGKGIGRAILQSILRRNRSQKRRSMLRVSLNNPAGLHLYGSLGFKPVSQTMVLGEKVPLSKTAQSIVLGGGPVHYVGKPSQDTLDTIDNTISAVRAGQFPIPGVTVAGKHDNVPLDVKPGEPAFFGMTGAGPMSDLPGMSGSKTQYTTPSVFGFRPAKRVDMMRPGNTQMYRWFDRAQLVRAIRDFKKKHPNNPLYVFGHSYGGVGAADSVRNAGPSLVDGLVMYDPVGWSHGEAPSTRHGTVSIYPNYRNPLEVGNIVADIGGRIPKFHGAENVYDSSGYNHVVATPALGSALVDLVMRGKADNGLSMSGYGR